MNFAKPISCLFSFALFGSTACESSKDFQSDAGWDAASDVSVQETGIDATSFDSGRDAQQTTTRLVASLDSRELPLDRAFFGFSYNPNGEVASIYLEAHNGGVASCPDQSSPSPDRTLVLVNLPLLQVGGRADYSGGVRASYLEFADPRNLPPILRATAVSVEYLEANYVPVANATVGLRVDAVFAEGSVRGLVRATHCDSMDEGRPTDGGVVDAGNDSGAGDAGTLDGGAVDGSIADASYDGGDSGRGAQILVSGAPIDCYSLGNEDCPSQGRCECPALGECWCYEGMRGTKLAGESASGPNECASSFHIPETNQCSKVCADETECPASLPVCYGVCLPPDA